MGRCCAIFVNREADRPDRIRKTKLPASCRKRRELWERWCEAGAGRVSLQGPMLNSNARIRVSASRFSGQHSRVAYSKLHIKHWEIGSRHDAAGKDSARRGVGSRSRWKIPSRYAARSARAVFATARGGFKAAIRGNARIAKSSSFSKKARSIATSRSRFGMRSGCAAPFARPMKSGPRRRGGNTSIAGHADLTF
jgi:hypothetical protein